MIFYTCQGCERMYQVLPSFDIDGGPPEICDDTVCPYCGHDDPLNNPKVQEVPAFDALEKND